MHPTIGSIATVLALLLTVSTVWPQEETQPTPVIEASHLAGSVWMLRSNTPIGNPTTVVSIGDDGVFIADPNLLQVGDALRAKIEELGGTKIRYITSTHHHGDHAEGYETFKGEGIGIVTPGQLERLATGFVVGGERPIAQDALPKVTFEESKTVELNGETIELLTLPNAGHTDSDIIVRFKKAGVLYVGDHLFLDRFPVIDVDGGGDLDGYIANIEWILEHHPEETRIVPGHGTWPPEEVRAVSMEEFTLNLETLKKSIAFIRGALEAGLPIAQLKSAGLPEDLAAYAQRPRYVKVEAWIDIVAGTQKKKKKKADNPK